MSRGATIVSEPSVSDVPLRQLRAVVPQNQALLGYWLQLGEAGTWPPPRAAFDPARVPGLLANLMIVEAQPEGFRVRLMGTALCDYLGGDLTGQDVAQALPRPLGGDAARLYRDMFAQPAVYLVRRPLARRSGARPEMEGLHLPFSGGDRDVRFAMTSLWLVDARMRPAPQDPVTDWRPELVRLRCRLETSKDR